MKLDCSTCPGRPRACDGCMMTVFLEAPTTRNGADDLYGAKSIAETDADRLHLAIETFIAAGLVDASAHDAVIAREHGGQDGAGLDNVRELRAS